MSDDVAAVADECCYARSPPIEDREDVADICARKLVDVRISAERLFTDTNCTAEACAILSVMTMVGKVIKEMHPVEREACQLAWDKKDMNHYFCRAVGNMMAVAEKLGSSMEAKRIGYEVSGRLRRRSSQEILEWWAAREIDEIEKVIGRPLLASDLSRRANET